MKPSSIFTFRLLFVLAVSCYMWGGFLSPHIYADKPIVVGTSGIHSAVKDLTGKDTELAIVVPPDLCPGHFDLKPSDIEKFINAKLVILHTWQKDLPAIKSLIRGTNPSPEKVVYIQVEGNWLVPKNYILGLEKVGAELIKAGLLTEESYKQQIDKRKKEILNFEQQILNNIKVFQPENFPVITSVFQSDFMNWLGFKVVATFPRTEEINLSLWGEILSKGKKEKAKIVVENLQSGEIELVKRLASELNAQSVILSGFPYACPSCNSWEASVQNNIDILLKAVKNTH
ncbi:MAG TPA: zinc ABC transporter substrate-binding protein [Candidatus Hydrogenedens sp.]|nr:zinc ABC transporter substrate-binding protein [Candidatus Hydrogenedens sp.]HOL21032.1 zinc ABC transporter substrate-binding protein [Candidatus Hydrogenedens sp.]HPP58730.1 zinc ABC transporter substrate-binding protein [Candidatus Hydrogenedens sp.]